MEISKSCVEGTRNKAVWTGVLRRGISKGKGVQRREDITSSRLTRKGES